MTPQERWLPVPGFEGSHEVSDQGRVRTLARQVPHSRGVVRARAGRVLAQSVGRHRYLQVELYRDSRRYIRMVHHLVLLAFVGPRPDGMVACHFNDDRFDNRLDNLRWDTVRANSQDALRNGVNPHAKRTHCKRGHEFTEDNIWRDERGNRNCRACKRARQAQARQKASAA